MHVCISVVKLEILTWAVMKTDSPLKPLVVILGTVHSCTSMMALRGKTARCVWVWRYWRTGKILQQHQAGSRIQRKWAPDLKLPSWWRFLVQKLTLRRRKTGLHEADLRSVLTSHGLVMADSVLKAQIWESCLSWSHIVFKQSLICLIIKEVDETLEQLFC